ncbi:MAG TPA: hypothetical protein VD905_00930, partial [Flavobacteriales bacterium]|nr:hypothetical protein [Flavobacteriales bacterium]
MRFITMGIRVCLAVFTFTGLNAQRKNKCTECKDMVEAKPGQFKKGEFFFSWGYNRAAFTKSDIAFSGPGIDFTLSNVAAKDRPTPLNFNDYFVNVTIPQ